MHRSSDNTIYASPHREVRVPVEPLLYRFRASDDCGHDEGGFRGLMVETHRQSFTPASAVRDISWYWSFNDRVAVSSLEPLLSCYSDFPGLAVSAHVIEPAGQGC